MPSTLNTQSDLDPRFALTRFVIEANAFEQAALWDEYRDQVKWSDQRSGVMVTVGWLDDRPVNLSALWAAFGAPENLVLFWYPISPVVDYDLIDRWFAAYCTPPPYDHSRRAFAKAGEFHHCLRALGVLA